MAVFIDTSILGRLANQSDPFHSVARDAIAALHRRGEILHIAPQNLIEFRNFATRPAAANGLGLTPAAAESLISTFETSFALVEETPAIYPAWKAIVQVLAVIGKQVHDARLLAICHVHAISHLMTFNVSHFTRMASYGPGITILDPAKI